jgi:hypothetical protein
MTDLIPDEHRNHAPARQRTKTTEHMGGSRSGPRTFSKVPETWILYFSGTGL